ncbi:MAG: hypothetical protein WAW61_13070 [Methylococcaceae bacterium]
MLQPREYVQSGQFYEKHFENYRTINKNRAGEEEWFAAHGPPKLSGVWIPGTNLASGGVITVQARRGAGLRCAGCYAWLDAGI